jgi:hypothetical protein
LCSRNHQKNSQKKQLPHQKIQQLFGISHQDIKSKPTTASKEYRAAEIDGRHFRMMRRTYRAGGKNTPHKRYTASEWHVSERHPDGKHKEDVGTARDTIEKAHHLIAKHLNRPKTPKAESVDKSSLYGKLRFMREAHDRCPDGSHWKNEKCVKIPAKLATLSKAAHAATTGAHSSSQEAYAASDDADSKQDKGTHSAASSSHQQAARIHKAARKDHEAAAAAARKSGFDRLADEHEDAAKKHSDHEISHGYNFGEHSRVATAIASAPKDVDTRKFRANIQLPKQ